MDLMSYIKEGALILIPALWIVGTIAKTIPKIPDWSIPLIIITLGIIGSMGLLGFNMASAIQGILVGGAAVGLHQVKKQID